MSTLLNVDPLLAADQTFDPADTLGGVLRQVSRDNRLWGIPIAILPMVIAYNAEQFTKAGIPLPGNDWTINAFTDALIRFQQVGLEPPFMGFSFDQSLLLSLIAAYGGLPFDYRVDPPQIDFTSPATVDAVRQVLDLPKKGYVRYIPLYVFTG